MRYQHSGVAAVTVLAAGIGPTDLTFTLADADGWPDGSIGPFWASLSKGLLGEEKVLCSGRSGTLVQVWTDGLGGTGRGKDGTSATDHAINSPVEHVWTAQEADELNAHIEQTNGAHGYPDAADLVTVDGEQTLTGKTLDGAVLEDPTLNNPTFTGDITGLPIPDINIGIVNVTASLTASSATHANKAIMGNHASTPIVVTLPSDTADAGFAIGSSVMLARLGAAATSFAAGSGATVNGTPGLTLRAQYSVATAVKIAANTWLVSGDVS